MDKEIKFIGYDGSKCDFDCANGEVQFTHNIGELPGKGFCNSISVKSRVKIPDGFNAIAIHQTTSLNEHLILADNTGTLYWCDLCNVCDPEIYVDSLHEIGAIEEIRCVTANGDTLIFGTTEGIRHMLWTGSHYSIIAAYIDMPTIDFGLQKAGNLITNETIVTDASSYRHIGTPGSGASTVHPSASDAQKSVINIGESIGKSYESALTTMVHQNGYFYQPFFVMYALRLADGMHIMHSSPILMLPTTLPPVIAITARAGDGETTYIDIDLTQNNYFELRYRINGSIPRELAEVATAIDIYISQPIMTYDAEKIYSGYMTKHTDMISATDSGGYHRGRHDPSRGEDDSTIFVGHFSLGNDNYVDHTTERSNSSVWCISPNTHFQDDLISRHPIYLVSSIPIAKAVEMSEFDTLDIMTSHYEKITQHERLDTENIALQYQYQSIIPTALTVYGNQLIAATNKHRVIAPQPLSAMAAYSGNSTSPVTEMEITVYTRHNGLVYKSARIYQERRKLLSDDFPRFLLHPDDSAILITIKQGTDIYTLPLTPDKERGCAYWYGGLSTDMAVEDLPLPVAISESAILSQNHIYISQQDSTLVVKSMLKPGCGGITAFAMAMQAPQNGHFGEYPLYTFADDGVYMLQYDDKAGTFTTTRKISTDRCVNADSITTRDNQIIYATQDEIKTLTGSKTSVISKCIKSMDFDGSLLPHFDELLRLCNIKMPDFTSDQLLSDCIIIYDTHSHSIIVSAKSRDFALIKHDESESWTLVRMQINKMLYSSNGDVAVDTVNRIVMFERVASKGTSLLVTRPIRLSTSAEGKRGGTVEVLGLFERGHVRTALYGAERQDDWHLLATSQSEKVEDCSTRSFRYIRLVILADLTAHEYIYGAR